MMNIQTERGGYPHGTKKQTVVVLGATPKADRFAYRAMKLLMEHKFNVKPVNPSFSEVLGVPCSRTISDVNEPIDTVTMYLGAARSEPLIEEIIKAKPRRIIFNPGSENDHLEAEAQARGIVVVRGCTLVMLASGAF